MSSNFVAYNVALDLVRALCPIVEQVKRHSAELADQIESAASSLVLNLGEGRKRAGKDPRRFYAYAQGSASEVRAALDLADAWGWAVDSDAARVLLDRELALLWGLTHDRKRMARTAITS